MGRVGGQPDTLAALCPREARLSIQTSESVGAYTKTIRLEDVIRSLRRGAPIAILVALVAAVLAYVVSESQEPVYRATANLVVVQPSRTFGSLELIVPPQVAPRVYQSALTEGSVIRDAMTNLNGSAPTTSELEAMKRSTRVIVESQQVSGLVRIDVNDHSAKRAADYANAFAFALVDWDRERARQVVRNSITALERSITDIDAQIASAVQTGDQAEVQRMQAQLANLREQRVEELSAARARAISAVAVGSIEIVTPAPVPTTAVGPRAVFNTFVAIVLGLLIGYASQFIRWSLRDEVGSKERLAQVSGLPVLAVFPRSPRMHGRSDAGSFLRANVLEATDDATPLVIGITSASSFVEKAGVATSLAERFATSGFSTLLVDADLRKLGPGAGIASSRQQVPGFEAYLQGSTQQVQAVVVSVNFKGSFGFIPSNAPTNLSSELLEYGLEAFLEVARTTYQVVILDLPPALGKADAVTAAPHCTGVVLCAGLSTNALAVREAVRALGLSGGTLLGTVLTGVAGRTGSSEPKTIPPASASRRIMNESRRGPVSPTDSQPVARVRQRG